MSESQADREDLLADVQEATEQRMHSAADLLHDPERVHEKAERLSDKAQAHRQKAQDLRSDEASEG